MALVTIERSPSPSDSADTDDQDTVDVSDLSNVKSPRQKSFSESYLTVKGAALILPQSDETAYTRCVTKSHGGDDIQSHLQAMFSVLRQQETIKVAVKLEGSHVKYLAVVSCIGRQDTEESVILGIDLLKKPTIGLVLPLWTNTHIRLNGDGGFCIQSEHNVHSFKPVSVQAMWSALQTLNKVVKIANEQLYNPKGLSHTWVGYYENKLSKETYIVAEWNASGDRDNWYRSDKLYCDSGGEEDMHERIRRELKNVMMTVDLEEVTCMFLRQSIEQKLGQDLNDYKSFIDTEMMEILGQMDAPSKILDYLYLGSEWNASNLEELQKIGIGSILNISREIDNFFPGILQYMNVREWDFEQSDLLRHWDDTYKYINEVREKNSKALVHCKMGISRSASTVIAYLMKEKTWCLKEAFDYTKSKRSIINPNNGFQKQLETYEGILKANMHRPKFDGPAKKSADVPDEFLFSEISPFALELGKAHPDFSLSEFIHTENDIEMSSRSADSTENSLPDQCTPDATENSPINFQYLGKCKTVSGDSNRSGSEQTDSDGTSCDEEAISTDIKNDNGKDNDNLNIINSESKVDSSKAFVPVEVLNRKVDDTDVSANFFNSDSKISKSEDDKSLLIIRDTISPASRESSVSKFRPDGSWIKPLTEDNDAGGINEHDLFVAIDEEMHTDDVGLWMGKKDDDTVDMWMEESLNTELQGGEDIDMAKDLSCNSPSTSSQFCQSIDPYIRENIPWNPGTVKKQKLSIETKYGTPSQAVNKKIESSEISETECHLNSNFYSVVKMDKADSDKSNLFCCESCKRGVCICKQSGDDVSESMEVEKENDNTESMKKTHETGSPKETEEKRKSVYKQEEINLPEGIVKKTLQKIEERNQQSIDLPRTSLRRSSSLKSPRKSKSKDRDNERRKTCTVLLLPRFEYTETELVSPTHPNKEQTKIVVVENVSNAASNHCQESDIKIQKCSSPEDVECHIGSVKVYKYLGEELTVADGLVRKQTLDIESKNTEKTPWQKSRSESSQNIQEQITPATVTSQRTIERKQLSPVELYQYSQTNRETAEVGHKHEKGTVENDGDNVDMVLSKMDIEQAQGDTSSQAKSPVDSCTVKEKSNSFIPKGTYNTCSTFSRRVSKQESRFDARTLELIREIGSALLNSPTQSEMQDVGTESQKESSRVNHYVRKIERTLNIDRRKPSNKDVIIIDKDSKETVEQKSPTTGRRKGIGQKSGEHIGSETNLANLKLSPVLKKNMSVCETSVSTAASSVVPRGQGHLDQSDVALNLFALSENLPTRNEKEKVAEVCSVKDLVGKFSEQTSDRTLASLGTFVVHCTCSNTQHVFGAVKTDCTDTSGIPCQSIAFSSKTDKIQDKSSNRIEPVVQLNETTTMLFLTKIQKSAMVCESGTDMFPNDEELSGKVQQKFASYSCTQVAPVHKSYGATALCSPYEGYSPQNQNMELSNSAFIRNGKEVRKTHGKSHPLAKLEGRHNDTVWKSPFYSSM